MCGKDVDGDVDVSVDTRCCCCQLVCVCVCVPRNVVKKKRKGRKLGGRDLK